MAVCLEMPNGPFRGHFAPRCEQISRGMASRKMNNSDFMQGGVNTSPG